MGEQAREVRTACVRVEGISARNASEVYLYGIVTPVPYDLMPIDALPSSLTLRETFLLPLVIRVQVDGVIAHYDELFRIKSIAAKADVFHLLSGMWKTPAERCFIWMGGFRPSELLKVQWDRLMS